VAESIELAENSRNLGEKIGADLIRQAARKLNKAEGDGTTTTTVLTYEILALAHEKIASGKNPMILRREIEVENSRILQNLAKKVQPIADDFAKITEVASISAGDKKLGKLISDVFAKIGVDGAITVEESQGLETTSEITEGFVLDRGYVSAYFANDTARMETVLKNPAVLITDKKITSAAEIAPILESLSAAGKKDLVIFAEEVDGEALGMLVLNRLKGAFNSVAVKAPSFGDKRKDVLADLAMLTGGQVISENLGMDFANIDLNEVIGSAKKIVVGQNETVIVDGAGDRAEISRKIAGLVEISRKIASSFDADFAKTRAAMLGGKVAVIKVGGNTETEITEKKFRIDDAIAATKAALRGGVVAGGGITLLELAGEIQGKTDGGEILSEALKKPFYQLMENAGLDGAEEFAKIAKKSGFGIDVMNDDKPIAMIERGIIDPANVTRDALKTAVSIAAATITMGAMVVEIPEQKLSSDAQ
jgi:chaperonin GroEL